MKKYEEKLISAEEAIKLVKDGYIEDGKTITGILYISRKYKNDDK